MPFKEDREASTIIVSAWVLSHIALHNPYSTLVIARVVISFYIADFQNTVESTAWISPIHLSVMLFAHCHIAVPPPP